MSQIIVVYDHPAATFTRIEATSYADASTKILDNLGISLFLEDELREWDAELYAEYLKQCP